MFFLQGQIIRRDDAKDGLHSGPTNNRLDYRSPTGDLFVVYSQIAADVVLVSLSGALETRDELEGAQRVAEEMYQQRRDLLSFEINICRDRI